MRIEAIFISPARRNERRTYRTHEFASLKKCAQYELMAIKLGASGKRTLKEAAIRSERRRATFGVTENFRFPLETRN